MRARIKHLLTAVLTGMFLVGTVWAGVGLAPVDDVVEKATGSDAVQGPTSTVSVGSATVELEANEALVGASKVSLEPDPAAYGGTWVRDRAACLPASSGGVDPQGSLTHAADPRVTWIENTNCIYMGGFGIGPSQPVLDWDTYDPDVPVYAPDGSINELGYGLWSRSVAISRGGGTVVLTILDGEGYFGEYGRMCGDTPCGAHDLSEQLAEEFAVSHADLGITADSFIFASTHAHSAMDFIGGWGGVPEWYMKQTADAMRQSVRDAVASLAPATIEAGDTVARSHNRERRDLYRSAEDPTVTWIRAVGRDDLTIATVGTFAAHATSFGSRATRAHADWPGVFDKRVEERFGGVGLMFEAGLGNMSSSGGWRMGARIGDLIPAVGSGQAVGSPDVVVGRTYWDQPVTNGPLGALGGGGFFDRPFGGPASVDVGKHDHGFDGQGRPTVEDSNTARCTSASAVSVHVSVTAARVGGVHIAAAPGEVFSNYTNQIEERAPIVGLAIGQANDALGYMPQSFESDHKSRQGGGFVGGGVFDYEDAYSIDACFGDMALESTLDLLHTL